MARRGWVEKESKARLKDDSIDLVFQTADGKFELELDESSDYVDVSIDTDGVDFSGMNDPAALMALGIPQPRKALLLQKEIAIPAEAQRLSFDDDGCMFYSTMKLEEAFAHFGNLIKNKGYRESRRPILSSSRNYTEFKRAGVELSVNIFTDPVGTRIVLEYDDGMKDPVVPPLPEVTLAGPNRRSPASEVAGSTPFTSLAGGSLSSTAEVQGDFVDITPPMPRDAEDFGRSGTNYSKTYTAKVRMSLRKTAEFYRATLTAPQWRAIEAPSAEASEQVLRFRNSIGTMTVKLKSNGSRTDISVMKHDDKRAKQDGVMPEPGKGRLIIANAHNVPVVFTIGKTDYPMKAGAGAENFKDALNYSVSPGKYTIIIKIPGQRPKTERIEITEGSSWAVVAVPTGGYLSMQLY
jgi:hypothetical protein